MALSEVELLVFYQRGVETILTRTTPFLARIEVTLIYSVALSREQLNAVGKQDLYDDNEYRNQVRRKETSYISDA